MSSRALIEGGRDFGPLLALVLDSLSSEHSRRAYTHALGEFFRWYQAGAGGGGFTKAAVQRYRLALEGRELAASSIKLRQAAIKKLAAEAADNGLLAPETAAAIGRVKGAKRAGVRAGNWLTKPQALELLGAPDRSTLKGKRDRVLLCLLLGCGLRRGELAQLDLLRYRPARGALGNHRSDRQARPHPHRPDALLGQGGARRVDTSRRFLGGPPAAGHQQGGQHQPRLDAGAVGV